MQVSEFDFELPAELIAQEPPPDRGDSRLLVLRGDELVHETFSNLGRYLRAGDLLVVNDTRVYPARLLGRRMPSGGAVECLLLRPLPTPQLPTPQLPTPKGEDRGVEASAVGSSTIWEALMHPGQKLKPGAAVLFEGEQVRIHGEVLERRFHGRRTIRLWRDDGGDLAAGIDQIGHIPLPPYIARDDRPADRDRYQTVYARDRGSIAAPTAGLHFTGELLADLDARGVERAAITLHVGYGTFKPVRVEQVEDHDVDPETFTVSEVAAARLSAARREGRRVIAVGTTTTRALESLTVKDGQVRAESGETRLFIHPGHPFRVVDGLITNFHLPKSSLLMLVAAFGGTARVMDAYRTAVDQRYRFYSYGDAMLVLGRGQGAG